jgi:hypothetical protein
MTRAKVSYYHLFIHKSNVAMVVGVATNKGYMYKFKHLSTIIDKN